MTPAEAAALLGVPAGATDADIHRAYAARAATTDPADSVALDALARARDALLAGAFWHPPQGPQGPQAGTAPAPYPPQQYPPQQYPPQQYPPYAPAARRPASTGAILGWTIGGLAGLLVLSLVAVLLVFSGVSALRDDTSVPESAPTAEAAPDGSADSYEVDGVLVEPQTDDGWTFVLTAQEDCPAAEVTSGFADSEYGDTLDEHTDTVPLEAGVPYTYTIPDGASVHDYAAIDSIVCGESTDPTRA
ncbi:hypothetical protein [Leifsonia sp. NPDC080035]|uniref:J domain-containing protein n=1 Tax=Leifsonia sp. NPDC080035 TaxID=3143936 RepID=A0AAU7GGC5_9MICO